MPDTAKDQETNLLSWIAPARAFKRRNRDFYITVAGMAGVVCLILFLTEGLLPVLLIISLVFLVYVMSTVEPESIEYKITNKGIRIGNSLIEWNTMERFWFTKRLDNDLLIVQTRNLAGRLEIVINPQIKEQIKAETQKYLRFEEIPASGLDRLTNWISNKFPGIK